MRRDRLIVLNQQRFLAVPFKNRLQFMSDNTGTYVWDKAKGKVVKASDHIPSIRKVSELAKRMDPKAEIYAGYKSLEEQGKLGEVNDPEVQADGL